MRADRNAPDDLGRWKAQVDRKLRDLAGRSRSGGGGGLPNDGPFSSRYLGTNYPVSTSLETIVDFDLDDQEDDAGIDYAAGTWTIQRSGRYQLNSTVTFAASATGVTRQVRLMFNGVQYLAIAQSTVAAGNIGVTVAKAFRFVVGDTLQIRAYHDASATLNVVGGGSRWTNADLSWVGP